MEDGYVLRVKDKTMKKGDILIWDSGFGYDYVSFDQTASTPGKTVVQLLTGSFEGSMATVEDFELTPNTIEKQLEMVKKYKHHKTIK